MKIMDNLRSIRFHLEKDMVPIAELKRVVSEFLDMVICAAQDYEDDITWFASVEEGSQTIIAHPKAKDGLSTDPVPGILDYINQGLFALSSGIQPEGFPEKAINHYQRLSDSFLEDGKVTGNPTIQITGISDAAHTISIVPYNEESAVRASLIHSIGSVKGMVKTMSAAGPKQYLILYDEFTGKRVKVFYAESMLDTVRKCFLRHVRVTGVINYNKEGSKISIEASSIEMDEQSIAKAPSFIDLHGVLEA